MPVPVGYIVDLSKSHLAFGSPPLIAGADELQQTPDELVPEVGTDGTLISMTFTNPKIFAQPQNVNFRCQNHPGLPVIQQTADIESIDRLRVPFLRQKELDQIRIAVFNVEVDIPEHTPLKFIWVGPSTWEALEFLNKNNLPPNVGGREEGDDDYNDYGNLFIFPLGFLCSSVRFMCFSP